jgi:hypothetical protein
MRCFNNNTMTQQRFNLSYADRNYDDMFISDNKYFVLKRHESINIEFEQPKEDTKNCKIYDFAIISKGYYEMGVNEMLDGDLFRNQITDNIDKLKPITNETKI